MLTPKYAKAVADAATGVAVAAITAATAGAAAAPLLQTKPY